MKKIIPAALAALLLAGCGTSLEAPPASAPETTAETQFTEAASTAPAETQATFPETQALPTETPGLS